MGYITEIMKMRSLYELPNDKNGMSLKKTTQMYHKESENYRVICARYVSYLMKIILQQ